MHLIHTKRFLLLANAIMLSFLQPSPAQETTWPGYTASPWFNEQVREVRFAEEVRAIINAPQPEQFDSTKPTHLIIYATPNGNSVEQTLGCQTAEGLDWHFNIQQVAAQVRSLRALRPHENIVLACVQPNNRSWPVWKRLHHNGPQFINQLVHSFIAMIPSKQVRVTVTGHSGGGSLMFGLIDANDTIPASIDRIAMLDANYSYANDDHHGEKILAWLDSNEQRRFIFLAYDDRNILYNGKKVVGPTGGTFRACHRMIDFLKTRVPVKHDQLGQFDRYQSVEGRLLTLIHSNPENKILHTRLVGEMNGLLYVLTVGEPGPFPWDELANKRTYIEWIQPNPYEPSNWNSSEVALSPRRPDASSATEFFAKHLQANQADLEQDAIEQVLEGNVPSSLRQMVEIRDSITGEDGEEHNITYRVMPDYLAIGSDNDFVRLPVTPNSAQYLADLLGCVLPTRKMVDDIYQQASVKLEPQPLTEDRSKPTTFLQHHQLIELQRPAGTPSKLIAGIKKDVVVTNKLREKPNRVAIYGWHRQNGKPIQPLYTGHVDWYVDYSHGARLVHQWATVDGQPMRIEDILADPKLCPLLSDEGPIIESKYKRSKAE